MQKHPDSLENQNVLRQLIQIARDSMTPEEMSAIAVDDEYRPEPKRRRSR